MAEKRNKGFSGLSDLGANIDEILNAEKLEREKKEKKEREKAEKKKQKTAIKKTSTSTEQKKKPQGDDDSNTFLGIALIVGIFFLIIIAIGMQSNTKNNHTPTAVTTIKTDTVGSNKDREKSIEVSKEKTETNVNTYVEPKVNKYTYKEEKPSAHTTILNSNHIRYCLAEKIRLDASKNTVNQYSQSDINRYNTMSQEYNNLCSNKKYYQNDWNKANSDVNSRKYTLQQEGRNRFYKAPPASTSNNTYKKPSYTPKAKSPSKYSLTVKPTPSNARVQIMNIKPKYYDGMKLKKGKYHIKVSKKGYSTVKTWIKLEKDEYFTVVLKKKVNNKKPNMSRLTSGQRNSIESTCGWRKSTNGPADYYQCIRKQINKLGTSKKPNMSRLTSGQRNSIESTCGWRKSTNGPADYYQCIKKQINKLGTSKKPNMSRLTSGQRNSIESTCGWRKSTNGPADYYQCIKKQINKLGTSKKPNMSRLTSGQRNSIESTCGWRKSTNGPADYYQCIKKQINQLGY